VSSDAWHDTSAVELPVVLGITVVASLVMLRRYGARRVLRRQGRFVWLMFVPTLIGSVGILWAGIRMWPTAPLFSVIIAIAGGLNLAVYVRFLTRLSRAVNASGPQDDLGTVMTEPMVDLLLTIMGLVLIGGLVALVGSIAWGFSQAAR